MRIAIIGGGAAGLITGWLLGPEHDVHIYEASESPGGHVCTLGGNVDLPLPGGFAIENGVLGFHRQTYPCFIRLMDHLGVELLHGRPYARLYTGHSVFPIRPQTLLKRASLTSLPRRLRDAVRVSSMVSAYNTFEKKLATGFWREIESEEAGPHLSRNDVLGKLQRAILMLSFSTPYNEVGKLPVGLAFPYLSGLKHRDWCYVKGGVFTYMQKLLNAIQATVHVNSPVATVSRRESGIEIHIDGSAIPFDACVFATSPGQIPKLFSNPTESESVLLNSLKDRKFETVAHTDDSIYNGFDPVSRTPMDLFVRDDQGAYNTYMSHEYRLPGERSYSFAYGLQDRISPEKIVHRQQHSVPAYTTEFWKARNEIARINGAGGCYYAGAWLGNGLHEGAVTSAMDVARLIGVPVRF